MAIKQIQTEEDMLILAAKFAKACQKGAIIYLHGPLGAGKTTFTRGFLRALGYQDKVKSPTYTLVESYQVNGLQLFHFDFYRLNDAKELKHIGIEEYFSPQAVCLVEWAEKGFPLLPKPDLACYIEMVLPGRQVKIEAHSLRGEEILKQL